MGAFVEVCHSKSVTDDSDSSEILLVHVALESVSVLGRLYIHTRDANLCPLIHGDRR